MITILVCGGRDYSDREAVNRTLDRLHARHGKLCIVSGMAPGADTLAEEWARSKIRDGVSFRGFRADWKKHGRAAGPIRNQDMLDKSRPSYVLAFPGGKGTADMMARAKEAGVPIMTALWPSP